MSPYLTPTYLFLRAHAPAISLQIQFRSTDHKPQIRFILAGEGASEISAEVDEPEKLVFYTSVVTGESGDDTDWWRRCGHRFSRPSAGERVGADPQWASVARDTFVFLEGPDAWLSPDERAALIDQLTGLQNRITNLAAEVIGDIDALANRATADLDGLKAVAGIVGNYNFNTILHQHEQCN